MALTGVNKSLAMLLLLVLPSAPPVCHCAQNITAILAAHPDLSEFSSAPASTGLADDISQLNDGPITVLAVNDTAMARHKPMPREAIRSHLSLHVLTDCYYDDAKLQRLKLDAAPTLVSTMFHAPGAAPGVHGMVSIVRFRYTGVPVGSLFEPMAGAVNGVAQGASFVKSVYGTPYSLSVLQVSGVMSPITPDAL